MITSIIGVAVLLGGLIFFHELGHYTIAKLFHVKVEVFSLGFGKKILTYKWGETEYCLSIIPLGGYVKLMGDDPFKEVPAHEAERAFSTQKLYKRFAIVAAGPTANLLLAYILYLCIFWAGQPVRSSQIGEVNPGTSAWEAGIRAGDRILAINGETIQTWERVENALRNRAGENVTVEIERGKTLLRIPITVGRVRVRNPYGEEEEVGGIKVISSYPVASLIGISNPLSVAYQAGLRSGDTVTKINTRPITKFDELEESLASLWKENTPATLTVKRKSPNGKSESDISVNLIFPKTPVSAHPMAFSYSEAIGIFPTDVFVKQLSPGSPAEKGGLQPNDRIVKIDGQPVLNFEAIVDQVQAAGAKAASAQILVERDGKLVPLSIQPQPVTETDPITGQPIKKYLIGFSRQTGYLEADMTQIQIRNPLELVKRAATETKIATERMVVSLAKLAMGKVSVKNLGGPVLIASLAGKSLDAGLVTFLQTMALISINLFLLNLFPIPVLDGGHLFFFAIEAIKGKPVSIRTMEIANQVGMVFILMLVGLTLFNDISRIVFH